MTEITAEPTIQIHQAFGPDGRPDPAEYRRAVESTVILPVRSVAIDVLVRLHATLTGPAAFTYADPGRGSGTLSLEGFDADDIERIDDYFRIQELSRLAGFRKAPGQFVDVNTYANLTPSGRNPIIMIVVGALLAIGSAIFAALAWWGPLRASPGVDFAWLPSTSLLLIVVLGVIIVIQHSRRLVWWLRVRALVKARGEVMPHGLRIAE